MLSLRTAREELRNSVVWRSFVTSYRKPKTRYTYIWWDGKLVITGISKLRTPIPEDYIEDPPRSRFSGEKRCVGKLTVCRRCGYRYKPKIEKHLWYCPECGEPRRCSRRVVTGCTTCVAHGAKRATTLIKRDLRKAILARRERLPRRMLEAYDEALQDKELLLLRRDLALVESRIEDLLDRADSGESGRIWRELRDTWNSFTHATRSGEEQTAEAYLQKVNDLIVEGNQDFDVWSEISSLVEQRKRLVESERRRLLEMHQMISTERVMALMERIALIIEKHVDDVKVKRKIGMDIKRLVEDDGTVIDSSCNILPVELRHLDERIYRAESASKTVKSSDS